MSGRGDDNDDEDSDDGYCATLFDWRGVYFDGDTIKK